MNADPISKAHDRGVALWRAAKYAQALEHLESGLALARQTHDGKHTAVLLNDIGDVYWTQGKYGQALDSYTQALDIAQMVGDPIAVARTQGNLGDLYQSEGLFARAVDCYQGALTAFRAAGERAGEGRILNNLGGVYQAQGQYAQAQDFYTEALAQLSQIGNRVGEGRGLVNLGSVYRLQGQQKSAEYLFEEALRILREAGDSSGEALALNHIGAAYAASGQYGEAISQYNQAETTVQEIGDRVLHTAILCNRAGAFESLGQRIDAIENYRAAVEIIESLLNDAVLDRSIVSLAAQNQNRWPYQRLAALLARNPDPIEAFAYAERGRAILLRTQLARRPINFRAGVDQELIKRELTLSLAVESAQRALDISRMDLNATSLSLQAAQTEIDQARQRYLDHLDAMQLRGGFLSRQLAAEVAPLNKIQKALPPDTTLVLYSIGKQTEAITPAALVKAAQEFSVAFVVTKDRLQAVPLEVAADQLAEAVRTFAADRRANVEVLSSVYAQVISPIRSLLQTSHLLIAPDGPLNYIPVAALRAPNGRHLLDDYAISEIPSATTLVLLRERRQDRQASSPGIALAQPTAPGLPRLGHAREEVKRVAEILGVSPIIDATETDLRTQAVGQRVVHISAHCELDHAAPLFGAILLKADAQEDGRFEIREIYEIDLEQGAQLAILSGCNTASGGEGEAFGVMVRAFLGAGVPRVVASLWSVDDAATADLLVAFMSRRQDHVNEADALRIAMQQIRQKYPEPYYWAGFVVTGLPN